MRKPTPPWDDCKVAFFVDPPHGNVLWDFVGWPPGWEVNAVDCSGARCVVVFRVSGFATRLAGRRVRQLLRQIEKGVKHAAE